MNKQFERIGHIITGMSAVTFILLMTITGMVFLSHGLFYRVLIKVMEPWHATMASWALSLGFECTVLICTCNTKFISRRLPAILAICSGVIVLFFIEAFDSRQTNLELMMRWLIGAIVSTVSYVYSELFYSKWKDSIQQKEIAIQLGELDKKYTDQCKVLSEATTQLIQSKSEIDRLITHVNELEAFKKREVDKLTCQCGSVFESIYKLTSHKGSCRLKQTNGQKQPGYNGMVTT